MHRVMKMKQASKKPYLYWILFTEAVGALAALLTRSATELYNSSIVKPALSPPAIVFPIVWVLLYALMGIGAARIWMTEPSPGRTRSLRLYLLQLGFNFFWSILFFNFQQYLFAFFWLLILWGLILGTILSYRKISPVAAYLQIPYAVWVAFAGYLNIGIWYLNR